MSLRPLRRCGFSGSKRTAGRRSVPLRLMAATGVLAKSASGALEHVPLIAVQNLARGLAALKERGFFVVGLDSGGEEGPVHSAALIVYHEQAFPLVSLRVDWDDENPIKVLRRLWEDYKPQMGAYLQRAIDPTQAPSYGVPGDP